VVAVGIGLKGLINEARGREELFYIAAGNRDYIIDDIADFQGLVSPLEQLEFILDDLCPTLCS